MPNDDGVSKSYLLWNMATFYVSMLNFMWDTFKTTHLHRSHAWKFCVECVMDSCPLQVTFFANGQPLWIINVYNTYTIYTCGMYISQCVYKYCIRNNIDSIKVYKKRHHMSIVSWLCLSAFLQRSWHSSNKAKTSFRNSWRWIGP